MGVFYHEGFGVSKNINKAIEYLTKASRMGNGQSFFQLYLIYSGKDGQDKALKNPIKAYNFLMSAIIRGVTYFDELLALFASNYAELAPTYLKMKNIQIEIKDENK